MVTKEQMEIGKAVKRFVTNDANKGKILLNKSPCGTGKSITTLLTLLKNEISFCAYYENHTTIKEKMTDAVLSPYEMFHRKGRMQKDDNDNLLCTNRQSSKLPEHWINVAKILCVSCKIYTKKDECPYWKQHREAIEHPYVLAPYQLLSEEALRENADIIVLDEHPHNTIISKQIFSEKQLDHLITILLAMRANAEFLVEIRIFEEEYVHPLKSFVLETYYVTRILLDMINELRSKANRSKDTYLTLKNREFIDIFISKCKEKKISPDDNTLIGSKTEKKYSNEYYGVLRGILLTKDYDLFFGKWDKKFFCDLLHIILETARFCFDHYNSAEDIENNLSIVWRIDRRNNYEKSYFTYVEAFTDLPRDRKIIINDATGREELYAEIFNREVETIDIGKRNPKIYQAFDGWYPKSSIAYEKTRNRLFKYAFLWTRSFVEKEYTNKVSFVIAKEYSTIENENRYTKGNSLEMYFQKKGLPRKYYNIYHHWILKGRNIPGIMENKVLVIIGTPEPDPDELYLTARAYNVGRQPIDLGKVKAPNEVSYIKGKPYFADEKLTLWHKALREETLIHEAHRMRSNEGDKKLVILLSNLPLEMDTVKTTMNKITNTYCYEYPSSIYTILKKEFHPVYSERSER